MSSSLISPLPMVHSQRTRCHVTLLTRTPTDLLLADADSPTNSQSVATAVAEPVAKPPEQATYDYPDTIARHLSTNHVAGGPLVCYREYKLYCRDFGNVDTNGDGQLSQQELGVLLATQLGREPSEREVVAYFRGFEVNRNGTIRLDEYITSIVGANWRLDARSMPGATDRWQEAIARVREQSLKSKSPTSARRPKTGASAEEAQVAEGAASTSDGATSEGAVTQKDVNIQTQQELMDMEAQFHKTTEQAKLALIPKINRGPCPGEVVLRTPVSKKRHTPKELRAQRFPKSEEAEQAEASQDRVGPKSLNSRKSYGMAAFHRTLGELSDTADPHSAMAAFCRTLSELSDSDPKSPIQDMTVAAFQRSVNGLSAGSA